MAEIAIDDLPASTLTRFGDDDAAQAALDAVLVAARGYCGWPVSPERVGDQLTLDGPGGRVLDLPTGKLNALTGVVEDGVTLDAAKLDWSQTGSVRKQSGASWSCRYRAITATIDHGYTEAEAADWRKAIIEMVGNVSRAAGTSDDSLIRKRVADVEYEWPDLASAAGQAVYSAAAVLDRYRLHGVLFA